MAILLYFTRNLQTVLWRRGSDMSQSDGLY